MSLKTLIAVPLAVLFACGPTPGHSAPVSDRVAPAAKPAAGSTPLITPPVFRQACLDLKPLQVGGWTIPPKPLHRVEPEYAPSTRQLGLRGIVVVATIIDSHGKVCDAQVVKGIAHNLPGLIDEPVRRSVLASTYTPATLEGHPVAVVFYTTVRVELGKAEPKPDASVAP